MHLSNAPEVPEHKTVAKHKKNASLGEKVITYTKTIFIEQEDGKVVKEGEEVTLMDWGNAIIRKIHSQEGGVVTSIDADLHLEGDYKKTEKKLTWLPDVPDLVPVKLMEYDYLITKEKLDENDDFQKFVNPVITQVTDALGDPNLRIVKKGDRFQLERRGYFIVDQPYLEFASDQPQVLILIPDGRATTQSHLASKVCFFLYLFPLPHSLPWCTVAKCICRLRSRALAQLAGRASSLKIRTNTGRRRKRRQGASNTYLGAWLGVGKTTHKHAPPPSLTRLVHALLWAVLPSPSSFVVGKRNSPKRSALLCDATGMAYHILVKE